MHHARTPLAHRLGPQCQTIRCGNRTVALGARVQTPKPRPTTDFFTETPTDTDQPWKKWHRNNTTVAYVAVHPINHFIIQQFTAAALFTCLCDGKWSLQIFFLFCLKMALSSVFYAQYLQLQDVKITNWARRHGILALHPMAKPTCVGSHCRHLLLAVIDSFCWTFTFDIVWTWPVSYTHLTLPTKRIV